MSVHGDLCAILKTASVAAGGAFPEFIPDDSKATDYVIVRRTNFAPERTLQGYAGITNSTFLFECWSTQKGGAIAMAERLDAAMAAQTTYPMNAQEPVSGEDFAPEVMELMEPRQYSIWHA